MSASYTYVQPLKSTLQVPTPPCFVVTKTSPTPSPGPDMANIFVGDFHSADSKQSNPQIVKP